LLFPDFGLKKWLLATGSRSLGRETIALPRLNRTLEIRWERV